MKDYREKPFELLRKKNGEKFSEETIREWYVTRSFVLQKLTENEYNHPFLPGSKEQLHVVLCGDDSRMLSVARQFAMYAHFLNFDEDGDDGILRRTIITIVSRDKFIKERLSSEEYLCNLPQYCRYVNGDKVENPSSYIDIELHIVPSADNILEEGTLVVGKDELDNFFERVTDDDESIFKIDTRKAYYASRMYCIGETIDNLPAENIHDAKRYTMALNVYQYEKLAEEPKRMFDVAFVSQAKLRETISNIFCSDCFILRSLAIKRLCNNDVKKEMITWEQQNEALSISEHARWVVEKLLMGYRSLSEEECHHCEILRAQIKSSDKIKAFLDGLKRDDAQLAHVDLCSYRDLRRINPCDLKYDSFLMLAIPKILQKMSGV